MRSANASRPSSFPVRPVAIVLSARLALGLPVADRYGWHRDELYYRVAGRHLQAGYVEFPPITPLLAALARLLFGNSLIGLRLFPLLAGLLTTVIAAQVARELGGSRRAMVIAAAAVGFSPLLVATNGLFQPVSFDQLLTMLVLWLAVRVMLGHDSWLSWLALGAAIGVGLETKYTLGVVVAFLALGALIWRRDALEAHRLGLVAVTAFLVFLPNLIWQGEHGWVSIHWFLHPAASASDESRPLYIGNLLLLTHVVAVPVAVAGVVRLWRRRDLRPLAFVTPAVVLFYFATGGKSYYALPVVMFALACGAVPFDTWATSRRFRAVGIAFVALLVVLLPIGLPVLSLKTAEAWHILDARSDYKDEIGWRSFTTQVTRKARRVDVILTRNYGEAGALELYARNAPPIGSPYVTFRYWQPAVSGRSALMVGFTRGSLAPFCSQAQPVGTISLPVDNDEDGRRLVRCQLRSSLPRLWPQLVARFGD